MSGELFGADFDAQHRLSSLNPVTISQIGFLNFLPVNISSIERAEVAQEATGRSNFQDAMITREVPVIGQAEMRRLTSSDQKSVVLLEDKAAPAVWA